MIKDKITIIGGEVISNVNIIEKDNQWEFINNDPQLHIRFKKPITDLKIKISLNEIFNKDLNMAVYYKQEKEEYSEQNSIYFNVHLFLETIQEIHFNNPVKEIRFDIAMENLSLPVKDIILEDISNQEVYECLKENFVEYSKGEKILILSHDFSNTGAPILAYNMAKQFKERGMQVIVLVGSCINNQLEERYRENKIPFVYLENGEHNRVNIHYQKEVSMDNETLLEKLIRIARALGYERVITNTVVSGQYVDILKKYNFHVMSLIHEMKSTILIYNFVECGEKIAKQSDIIVFPDEIVKNGFETIYQEINGKILVRPQGVYLKTKYTDCPHDLLSSLGISNENQYILGSGSANLRKGIDLFVNAATIMYKMNPKLHFIWAGEFDGQKDLEYWLKAQILTPNIHIIPFIKESHVYLGLLSNAGAFWLTSREDPFPSVALEAMSLNIPVLGFKDSGGFNTMAAENRGVLIDNYNVYDLAVATNEIVCKQNYKMNEESINSFIESLNFDQYIDFLYGICKFDKKIEDDGLVNLCLSDSLIPKTKTNENIRTKRSLFKIRL